MAEELIWVPCVLVFDSAFPLHPLKNNFKDNRCCDCKTYFQWHFELLSAISMRMAPDVEVEGLLCYHSRQTSSFQGNLNSIKTNGGSLK